MGVSWSAVSSESYTFVSFLDLHLGDRGEWRRLVRNARRLLALTLSIALLAIGTVFFIRYGKLQRKPHRVTLTWYPSTPNNGVPIAGYNVYRSTISGGPYVRLASRVPDTSYTDTLVNSERTYFYVVTAVNQYNRESKYSNEARAVIP